MMTPITVIYASVLALMLIALSVNVVRTRMRFKVGLGDGGKDELMRAVRTQANFVEYVPITLLLLFFMEQSGAAAWGMHLFGSVLIIGRVSHAYSVLVNETKTGGLKFRQLGMFATWSVMGGLALCLLSRAVL